MSRQAWLDTKTAAADTHHTHRANSVQACQRQASSDVHGNGVLAAWLGADRHRRGRVKQQITGQSLRSLVLLDVRFARASRHSPVDVSNRVAPLVLPRLDVLDPSTQERRPIGAVAEAISQPFDRNHELPPVQRIVCFEVPFQVDLNSTEGRCRTGLPSRQVRCGNTWGTILSCQARWKRAPQ